MSPLKLYEYLAAGLPVVSVDFPRYAASTMNGMHLLAGGIEEGMSHALGIGEADEARRLRFIESVSWERRMRPVVDAAIT